MARPKSAIPGLNRIPGAAARVCDSELESDTWPRPKSAIPRLNPIPGAAAQVCESEPESVNYLVTAQVGDSKPESDTRRHGARAVSIA